MNVNGFVKRACEDVNVEFRMLNLHGKFGIYVGFCPAHDMIMPMMERTETTIQDQRHASPSRTNKRMKPQGEACTPTPADVVVRHPDTHLIRCRQKGKETGCIPWRRKARQAS